MHRSCEQIGRRLMLVAGQGDGGGHFAFAHEAVFFEYPPSTDWLTTLPGGQTELQHSPVSWVTTQSLSALHEPSPGTRSGVAEALGGGATTVAEYASAGPPTLVGSGGNGRQAIGAG
jgi:hypothetical protein